MVDHGDAIGVSSFKISHMHKSTAKEASQMHVSEQENKYLISSANVSNNHHKLKAQSIQVGGNQVKSQMFSGIGKSVNKELPAKGSHGIMQPIQVDRIHNVEKDLYRSKSGP